MLPARILQISPEQNIGCITPPDQHKWDTDTVIPEGWKLGKDAAQGVEDVIQVLGHYCMQ